MLNLIIILIAILSFFIGYFSAPIIYKYNIKLLLTYPIWITKKLRKLVAKEIRFHLLFGLIIFFNSLSLFLILISEFIPFLPVLLLWWLGINLGVSISYISGKRHYTLVLLNPVAILEIIATIITGFTSIKFSIQKLLHKLNFAHLNPSNLPYELSFNNTINIYIHYSLPILFIAAIVETALIASVTKRDKGSDA